MEVNTASIYNNGGAVGPNGMYAGGGFIGDAMGLQLTQSSIDTLIWSGIASVPQSAASNINNYISNKNYKFKIFIDGKYKPNFLDFDKLLKIKKLDLISNHIIPLVKGDSKSKTIALASIIAKETRNNIMKQYSLKYPNYSFDKHFGYGTVRHKEAILKYGILGLHRKSFKPISTIYSE